MNKTLIAAAVAAAVSAPAMATPTSHIDGYFLSSGVEFEFDSLGGVDFDDDGDGFGVKGALALSQDFYLTGEYQSAEFDDTEFEFDQFRAGGAIGPGAGDADGFFGAVEYVNIDFDDTSPDGEQSGIAGHIGLAIKPAPAIKLYAKGGYVKLDDLDGPEFLVGANFDFAPNLGVFLDYRITQFEDEVEDEITLDDFRVGVLFRF